MTKDRNLTSIEWRPKADLAAKGPNLAEGPNSAEGPNLAEGFDIDTDVMPCSSNIAVCKVAVLAGNVRRSLGVCLDLILSLTGILFRWRA